MRNNPDDISLRQAALLAGCGLLVMTIFAILAGFFIFGKYVVPGNGATTVHNIMANMLLFRAGIYSYIIVIACDVLVAWALYAFLKPVNKSLSLLAALFRLVYATIFGTALANYLDVLHLLSRSDYLAVFTPEQVQVKIMLSVESFNAGWTIGFVFFSLHLLLLGYLVFRLEGSIVTRILGILLIIAGAGYLLDHSGKILWPDFNWAISMLSGWGELVFMFWLLFKGGRGRIDQLS